ncbi:MAG: hypothetical protein ACRD4V_13900, partial [Candidatus Acidiferrales bacterium]
MKEAEQHEPAKDATVSEPTREICESVVIDPLDLGTAASPVSAISANDAKLAYFNDPRFQQIYQDWRARGELLGSLTQILREGRYSIGSIATFRSVLEDAFTLYD